TDGGANFIGLITLNQGVTPGGGIATGVTFIGSKAYIVGYDTDNESSGVYAQLWIVNNLGETGIFYQLWKEKNAGDKYAFAKSISAKNYQITFNPNGGAGTPYTQTIATGSTAPLMLSRFTKAGDVVKGWSLTPGGSMAYLDGASYTIGSGDVTLYAVWVPKYNLRDTGPAGGWIFYDKGNYSDGWRYMEASPLVTEWNGKQFDSLSYTSIPINGTAIGTGKDNTLTVKTYLTESGKSGLAAQLCFNLNSGGYSDWFLPSRDELSKIYRNLAVSPDENGVVYTPVGDFPTTKYYWSSSVINPNQSYHIPFNTGSPQATDKNQTAYVRAVRRF
ncbi:MAG TPA: DUF1566 domain-containing protein, partial [Spirochaetota bacterium]|nr:DUF1566 domain-containing protein [Spirochaetota bacterium]